MYFFHYLPAVYNHMNQEKIMLTQTEHNEKNRYSYWKTKITKIAETSLTNFVFVSSFLFYFVSSFIPRKGPRV